MSSDNLFALGDLYNSSGEDLSDAAGDIVGELVDSGYDEGEAGAIVGAVLRRIGRPAARPAARRPAPRAAALGPFNPISPRVQYTPFNPTKTRRFVMGFQGNVLAAAVTDIKSNPQLPFRPERLVIPDTIGVNFLVLDLKIGTKSQLAASGGVSALTFAQNSVGVDLGMDTAEISQTISFSVQNLDGAAPHLFLASLVGTAMDNLEDGRGLDSLPVF